MKEFITANNVNFECESILTGVDSITFTIVDQEFSTLEDFFRDVKDLTISDTIDGEPYGIYSNLAFKEITKSEDGSISVTMRIKSDIEIRIEALEESQELQNGAIEDLAGIIGG